MVFYRDRILPHLIDLSMRNRELQPYRRRVLAGAKGRVLEIGIGAGANLPVYGASVEEIVGLEPSPRLIAMAKRTAERASMPVKFVAASAESVPVDSTSIDTVVTSWTLCSIPDAMRALHEMRRVLRPDGRLLFVEHGLAPDRSVQVWQNRLTPLWKKIGGGCHLNRPISVLIEAAGFEITRLDTGYMKGPKPMTYIYEGIATRKE